MPSSPVFSFIFLPSTRWCSQTFTWLFSCSLPHNNPQEDRYLACCFYQCTGSILKGIWSKVPTKCCRQRNVSASAPLHSWADLTKPHRHVQASPLAAPVKQDMEACEHEQGGEGTASSWRKTQAVHKSSSKSEMETQVCKSPRQTPQQSFLHTCSAGALFHTITGCETLRGAPILNGAWCDPGQTWWKKTLCNFLSYLCWGFWVLPGNIPVIMCFRIDKVLPLLAFQDQTLSIFAISHLC